MDFLRKIFISIAFVLFVLALVWLFTYEQPGHVNTSSAQRIEKQDKEPEQTTNQQPTEVVQQNKETNPSGQSVLGNFGEKDFTRDGQKGVFIGNLNANGEPDGYGVLKYKNGNYYIGKYENGERNGNGNAIFGSNKVNLRVFDNGTMKKDDTQSGWKLLKNNFTRDGQSGIYIGPAKDGAPIGYGMFKYNNGDIYIGRYENRMREGEGTFCQESTKKCFTQVYKNGKIVE